MNDLPDEYVPRSLQEKPKLDTTKIIYGIMIKETSGELGGIYGPSNDIEPLLDTIPEDEYRFYEVVLVKMSGDKTKDEILYTWNFVRKKWLRVAKTKE